MKLKPFIPSLAVLMVAAQASASLLAYDGFLAGGEFPAANEYQSEPASTNGTNNDALHGQAPDRLGFSTENAWVNQDSVAASVYPRVNSTGLTWTNQTGTESLITTAGALEIFRSGSASGGQTKGVRRNAIPTTGGLGDTFYMSGLLQFSPGTAGSMRWQVGSSQTGGPREHFFGFNASGNLVAGTGNTFGTSTDVFAADTTHLVIARFHDGGQGNRTVQVWANPASLTNPGTADYTFAADHFGGHNLNALILRGETGNSVQDPSFIFDEARLGFSFESVAPIPEPGTLMLLVIAMGTLAIFRRRK
ncbi:MAG: PEP-CTERM sorting domain-containing protein [Verrucomicrobia bacterium]|nr:PEP-CTERM sorting domain-containing protein [Verrucomicrobiota bacterium]MCH8512122.1 PEP-CTERM sorting domain-containing protein [Kiritimatiellia bacterium]